MMSDGTGSGPTHMHEVRIDDNGCINTSFGFMPGKIMCPYKGQGS